MEPIELSLLLTLWAAAMINLLIVGHIVGAQLGLFLARLVNSLIGFEIKFENELVGTSHTEHFKGREAWVALGDLETIKRHARKKQLTDIEGTL